MVVNGVRVSVDGLSITDAEMLHAATVGAEFLGPPGFKHTSVALKAMNDIVHISFGVG
jgi:hypothetical protein